MANGAATEDVLGELHSRVALVFIKALKVYEDSTELEPNPALLSAMTKFLKDNEIAFATKELDILSDTEQRLAARRKQRGSLVNLTNLKVVDERFSG